MQKECDCDKGKRINLCIAKHCFLTCKGCYNVFCDNEEISGDKIIEFLSYAKEKGLSKVTFSGGDPLTRKDFSRILSECKKLCVKVNLDTVGLTFTKARKIPSLNIKVDKFEIC